MFVVLKQIPVKEEGLDRWVWKGEKNRIFSVKSTYNLICVPLIIKGCGMVNLVPLNVEVFVWKLAQDRIPSFKNLVDRNVISHSGFCKGS